MSRDIPAPQLADLDAWRQRLRKLIFAGRRTDGRATARHLLQTEWGAARFHLYRFYRSLSDAGLVSHLIDQAGSRPGPTGQPVGHLLRFIDGAKPVWNGSSASRLAMELEFALSHDIDPDLILGFLSEVGSQQEILRCYKKGVRPEAVDRYKCKRGIPA